MSDLCTPTFADLAGRLGFSCDTAGGLVAVRNPFALENWTLPVLEITVVIGAVLALAYAIRRLRRDNDPTNIVLWFGAIAYLLIIEPPLYFPGAFGIADHVDTMFAHNVFTIDFLWGRLPLYIIAIYPMMATVAFEIVRSLGVFRRYGTLIGAASVGFVHHCFYEIFDHLGPQLRWWEWTLDHPMNQPFFASVPLPSVVVFAALWPMSLALCVQFFVGRHVDNGRQFSGAQIIWRTVVIGLLASIGTAVLPLPATVAGGVSGSTTVAGVVYALELVAVALVAVPVLVIQWQRQRGPDPVLPMYYNTLIFRYSWAYLAVMALLWATALPAYLAATDGRTSVGDPIGSLWYTLICFLIAALCLSAAMSAKPRSQTPANRDLMTPAA